MDRSSSSDGVVVQRLAHDLNNPLTAVRVLADLILEDAEGPLADDLAQLVSALDQASVLTEGLGLFGRVLGEVADPPTTRALGRVVRDACDRASFASVTVIGDSQVSVLDGPTRRALTTVLANAVRLQRSGVIVRIAPASIEVFHPTTTLDVPDDLLTSAGCDRLRAAGVRVTTLGLWLARAALEGVGGRVEARNTSSGLCVVITAPRG